LSFSCECEGGAQVYTCDYEHGVVKIALTLYADEDENCAQQGGGDGLNVRHGYSLDVKDLLDVGDLLVVEGLKRLVDCRVIGSIELVRHVEPQHEGK